MTLNGHYSGRLTRAVKKTVEKATGRDGKFYEIFNKHNFYDVDDPNNNLTKEQREQVPRENQTRFTQFSSAIAEMFSFVLADAEYGVLTKDVQNIIDKLDVRASSNKSSLDGMGNVFKASASVPIIGQILSGAEASSKAMESLTTSIMGTNPFNPDLIPPISLGFPGLPAGVANTFKSGFFQPNWDFMYEQESGKSNSLWLGPDGYYRLGANISLYEGGERFQLFLKTIWGVAGVDRNLNPVGDIKGGLSPSDYEFLKDIADKKGGVASSKATEFTITDDQMRNSFFRYAQLKLWDVINNRRNWAHGHWGQLTHNSIPEYVKSAVSSYIWTTGLALDAGNNSEASLISYCSQMGLCYLVGYQYKLEIWGIDGINKKLSEDGNVVDIQEGELELCQFGVPKDEDIAKRYFTWIADLLVRSTNNSSGDEIALPLRRRRIAEANLIYRGQGQPVIEFGKEISQLSFFHQTAGLLERKFDKIIAADYNRYKNEGAPGGEGNGGSIQTPESFKSTLEFGADESVIQTGTKNFIRAVMDQSGVTYGYVTSTIRTAKDQARAMFNNLQNGNVISYSSKANKNKGWGATLLYYEEKRNKKGNLTRSYSRNTKVTDASDIAEIKSIMTTYIDNENKGGRLVSKHCGDPGAIQVMDISPKRMRPQSRRPAFVAIMRQQQKDRKVRSFITPEEGDPAYHIELADNTAKEFETSYPNAALPTEPFNVRGNGNLSSQSSWLAPLSKDYIMVREANG